MASRIAARRVADRMKAEIGATTDSEFKDPTGEYVGTIVSGTEKTGAGYRAFLTIEGDEEDIIKSPNHRVRPRSESHRPGQQNSNEVGGPRIFKVQEGQEQGQGVREEGHDASG